MINERNKEINEMIETLQILCAKKRHFVWVCNMCTVILIPTIPLIHRIVIFKHLILTMQQEKVIVDLT